MAGLTDKQRIFCEVYLATWNATEAARQAGYAHPHVQGSQTLANVSVAEFIKARIADKAMTADEVLVRLADQARGSLSQFLTINNDGELTGFDFGEGVPIHLVKKAKITEIHLNDDVTKRTVEIEILDPQAALFQLGKHHGLFVEKVEHTGKDGGPIETKAYIGVSPDDWNGPT